MPKGVPNNGKVNRVERTCPWCGKKLKAHFEGHIKNVHGKTWEDYTLSVTGLSEIPTCARPGCTNKVYSDFHQSHNGFTQYCCNACAQKDKALQGKSPFQPQNWEKYDIYNKMIEGKAKTFGSTANNHKTGPLTLYIGLFKKEGRFKIGTTSTLYGRSRVFKKKGIIFDEFVAIEGPAEILTPKERELMLTLKEYWNPLSKEKYPYKKSEGYSVGNSEWFSEEGWDKAKNLIEQLKNSTTMTFKSVEPPKFVLSSKEEN